MVVPRLIVAIGGTGEPDLLERLLAALPKGSGLAVIVTHHAPPDDRFEPATEETTLEGDKLYRMEPGSRTSIDHLFRSLALKHGSSVAGILLSGAGHDGTTGLREIRAAGGLAIVQAPDTAHQTGLADSAIEAGVVDLVLPIEQIAGALIRFSRTPSEDVSWDTAHHRLAAILETRADFGLDHYKPATVKRRVLRRMGLAGFDALEPYFEHLRASEQEQQALVRDLLIGVTDFFRNPEAFEELRATIVRDIVRSTPPGDVVRIWVPGCATGEEAYSIAMLVLEEFEGQDIRPELHLFATDVDETALRTARAGLYPMSISAQVPADLLKKYFRSMENRRFQVKTQLRDLVSFAVHDLCNDPPFSRMDLVSCRNVFIYLTEDTQERVLRSLHFALKPNRYLFLGTSESVGKNNEIFTTLSKSWRIYKKVGPSRPFSPRVDPSNRSRALLMIGDSPKKERRRIPGPIDAARDALLESCPPAIVVSSERHIIYSHGELGPYLRFPPGEPRLDLMAAVRPDLTNRVRAALFKCTRDEAVISVTSSLDARELPQTKITVRPAPALGEGAVVITFEELQSAPELPPSEAAPEDEALIDQLERELTATREDLHSTVEELETSNEELRASHEESMSMNEELQSANEELEATTEELRSLNEELSTVNTHLKEKVDQLEHANNDLRNFFSSTKLATIFLDEELRIVRFTPAAAKLLRLGQADQGRHIRDIARDLLRSDLVEDARAVLDSLVSSTRELLAEGRCFVRRVLPYRTENRRIEGVVVNFIDITDLKEATDRLAVRERQQAVVARLGLRALEDDQLDAFLDQVVTEVMRTLAVDMAWILELVDGRELHGRAASGWGAPITGVRIQPTQDVHLGHTLTSTEPVIIEDIRTEKRFSAPAVLHQQSYVSSVSCLIRDGSFGVLEVHSKEPRSFTTDDANFLQAVANVVGSAIERDKARTRLAIDRGVAQVLAESGSFAEATPRILEVFARELDVRICELWTPTNGGEELECTLFLTPAEPYRNEELRKAFADRTFHRDEGTLGRVWSKRRAEWTPDLSGLTFARASQARALGLVSGAAFPILFGAKTAGVMAFFSRRPLLFDRSMLDLLDTVGRAIGEFLRRTESFREVAESIPHLVWTARADGVNEYFNKKSLAFFGRSLEEMTRPDAWLDSVHPDDRTEAERAWKQATASGREYRFDVRLRRASDGEYLWHEIHAVPMQEEERILRWIGTCTNIHERKLVDAALKQAHQQKDQFLAMLGHELRNPLAAIRSAYELMRLKLGDDPRVQRAYAILDRQTSHMVKLIDGLLDVSRIVRGKVTLERDVVDLSKILLDVVSDASHQITTADLRVETSVPEPLMVDGDPVRLAQVFDNLLANAIKFSRPAGTIRVAAKRLDQNAVVTFTDDGIGIDNTLLINIFEPFQQATPTLDRSPGGLGLGLALVKGLMELHGGSAVAKSDGPGSGAEFELTIPLARY